LAAEQGPFKASRFGVVGYLKFQARFAFFPYGGNLGTSLFPKFFVRAFMRRRRGVLAALGNSLTFPPAVFATPEEEFVRDGNCFDGHLGLISVEV
jgi:hypothetical protein